jgi:hypothetical protein
MEHDIRVHEKSEPQFFEINCHRSKVGIGQYGYSGQGIDLLLFPRMAGTH